MAPKDQPMLFFWGLSAWASKVTAYCALRKIKYTHVEQPITMPRPDLAALGVKYRRIPLMAVGRDMYCDTLLIMEKLEEFYPTSDEHPQISGRNPTEIALEKLFEKWTDAVVFKAAAAVIPSGLDLMKDPAFQKDREELWGRPWHAEEQDRLRPAALADMRAHFQFLEDSLSDGREWLLGGDDGPRLVDIHACWIFDWLLLLDSFDASFFNKKTYPKTFAWQERYREAVKAAKEKAPEVDEMEGPKAVETILKSDFNEPDMKVEEDPEGLKSGQEVVMYPTDTGYNTKDRGKLVGLSKTEMVIDAITQQGGKEIRIHYPRWNFAIEDAKKAAGKPKGEQNGHGSFVGTDHIG